MDWRVKRGEARMVEKVEEEKISREELRKVMRKLRDRKAKGRDGIPNDVWKYGGEEVEN